MAFPEYSLQSFYDIWWEKITPSSSPKRGDLLWVMTPHKLSMPTRLVPKRQENQPGDHNKIDYEMEQFSIHSKPLLEKLPIAGLPNLEDGSYTLQPVKVRPALVIASSGDTLPLNLTQGLAGYQKAPCFIVAPYYGMDKDGKRGGFPENLMKKIWNCQYRHFFADSLPLSTTKNSLLRLDHTFSIVDNKNHYKHTNYRLSEQALAVFCEYWEWFLTGCLPTDSIIKDIMNGLEELGNFS